MHEQGVPEGTPAQERHLNAADTPGESAHDARFEDSLDYPVVLKVPDGSFRREVKKAVDFRQFQVIAYSMFKESEIVLVQDFMYTEFDWRIGVLDGVPLFVARYFMVRDHWQIIKHAGDGQPSEGRTEAVKICDTPPEVLGAATAAARLIGDGFHGVDLTQNAAGVFVIEINDNPNLDAGAEDKVLGDEVYRRLLRHLLAKFEARDTTATPPLASTDKTLKLAIPARSALEPIALNAQPDPGQPLIESLRPHRQY